MVYDDQSNLPEVERLAGTTATETISKISAIFARYGIPVQVCTDSGPQFASRHFAAFARRYDFKHITSSPHFPRSNGLKKACRLSNEFSRKLQSVGRIFGWDFWLNAEQ